MGRRRIRKRRTNSKSMHAVEPTAKRRKQNRVSIKTGVRTRFFLLHFQYTQLYRKNERKSEKTPPTGRLSGIIMHICADATDMKRKGKFENRKTARKTECRRSRKLGSCPASEVSKLRKTVNSFAYTLEKAHFLDYVQYASNEKRIFRRAFLTGLLRGFGTAVGVTVLGAVIIYAFQALAKSNLPYIADFISDIIDIIEKTRK